MTIHINGVEVDQNLRWLNRWENPKRSFSSRLTIDGITVNQNRPIVDHRTIRLGTLQKNGFYGYWTETQIEQIETLERSGAIFTFIYHSILSINAVVIPGTIKMDQLTPSNTTGYGDAYIGSVDFKAS